MRPSSSPSEEPEGRAPHFVQSLERGLARHPRVRRAARRADAVRRRALDRADARGGAALPAHARRPRLRAHRRALVLAHPAGARARLRVPVEPVAARGRRAAPGAAGGGGPRVLVGVGARRRGHRLRRARADLADHDRVDQRRDALPGLRDLDGARAAGRALGGRSTPTWRDVELRRAVAAHDHLGGRAAAPSWRRCGGRAGRWSTRSSRRGCARWRRRSATALARRGGGDEPLRTREPDDDRRGPAHARAAAARDRGADRGRPARRPAPARRSAGG